MFSDPSMLKTHDWVWKANVLKTRGGGAQRMVGLGKKRFKN